RPFGPDFTLIGTTDEDFAGDPAAASVEAHEIAYLCDAANAYLRQKIGPGDVVWAFAGVRALYDDGAASARDTTREYALTLDREPGRAPLLTVYGGKITTSRRLAEAALARLAAVLPAGPAWTARRPLPGGDFKPGGDDALAAKIRRTWPFLSESHARR